MPYQWEESIPLGGCVARTRGEVKMFFRTPRVRFAYPGYATMNMWNKNLQRSRIAGLDPPWSDGNPQAIIAIEMMLHDVFDARGHTKAGQDPPYEMWYR
jgi:hypothetical protein